MIPKTSVSDLSIFGGGPLFENTKSTSNLVRPDIDIFLKYSKQFYNQRQFTNNGPIVNKLEKRLAVFHQTKFCISFCSGFWTLVLCISSLALKGKSEIVMPSLTYRRMADIAAWVKLKPHFCEVEESTLSMSSATAEPCINDNTALILGVHPIVNCCDINGLVTLARDKGIPILFDSVESVYESTGNGKVGRFGDAEAFSLHASKFINGFEGGYITTNDSGLAKRLSSIRTFGFHGMDNVAITNGMNAKLNEIHAAMALANLDAMEDQIFNNRERYYAYKHLLSKIPGIRLLEFDERYQTGYKNIVVELLSEWPLPRENTVSILNAENVLARAHYSPPLHQKKMKYPFIKKKLPGTDFLADKYMNLPCGYFVNTDDIRLIVDLLMFMSNNSDAIKQRLQKAEVLS